ncbi:hypothetical protein HYC85_008387 [Camellia sinensis]|uniref:Plectin/eS10 N-terminal domain-containing protein n=1 Tax=Camellia sinensis TaxID=4442 RepID=A0A7J7HTD4_CAMSI|nr:hypothetical protein HYC85_008387 [Camellia sinensis]
MYKSFFFVFVQIIPEKNRIEISKHHFQGLHFLLSSSCVCGVFYAKKDYDLVKHPDIDEPNLQVIKLMRSFKSNEYIIPNTLKRMASPILVGGHFGGSSPGDHESPIMKVGEEKESLIMKVGEEKESPIMKVGYGSGGGGGSGAH